MKYLITKTAFKIGWLIAFLFFNTQHIEAQFFKKILKKAKAKIEREAEERTQKRINKKIDKTFDDAEKKLDGKGTSKNQKKRVTTKKVVTEKNNKS